MASNSVDVSPNGPQGSAAQNALLFYGRNAVIAFTSKTYANLANNQTLIVAETNGATPPVPVLVTFEIEKSASGWTPTGGSIVVIDETGGATLPAVLAIRRDFLNARPNAAYTWAINGTSDGLIGTAKYAGSPWNVALSGTTLSGAGSITTTGLDPRASAPNALRWLDGVSRGVVPPFVAGAASIAPGTDGTSGFVIDSYITLSAPSALTLASTGTPVVGNKLILCMALSLGNTLSIVNGPLANTIASFPAALTRPRGAVINWDGFNFSLVGYIEGET